MSLLLKLFATETLAFAAHTFKDVTQIRTVLSET